MPIIVAYREYVFDRERKHRENVIFAETLELLNQGLLRPDRDNETVYEEATFDLPFDETSLGFPILASTYGMAYFSVHASRYGWFTEGDSYKPGSARRLFDKIISVFTPITFMKM